jgi:hypothetical protein
MASAQTTQLLSSLQTSELSTKNPSVYQIIRQLILSVDGLSADVLTVRNFLTSTGAITGDGVNVANFVSSFTERNIILSWDSLGVGCTYEIREGTVWATADYVTTSVATSAPLDPRVVGTYYFLIKGTDPYGRESASATALTLTVPSMGSITATYTVVSNSVLLYWSKPTSTFLVHHYDIYRGTTLLGEVGGTFFAFFEAIGGIYDYSIIAVDIIGNTSPQHVMTIPVGDPNDFILLIHSVDTAFAGTKVNALAESDGLLVPVNTTETWSTHFSAHSWADINGAISAGYSVFIQPTLSYALYTKVLDFGAIVHNVSATVSYDMLPLVGTVDVAITLEGSTDGSTWGTPITNATGFFTAIRYITITMDFTPVTSGYDLALLRSMTCDLNVQIDQDGGNVNAVSTDSGGTEIDFNKDFLDVISITATALSTEPAYAVYAFTDIPNPTSFKVMVYDSMGNRISKLVSWKARGIV